jgi:broad specificity phosphatase PhoE
MAAIYLIRHGQASFASDDYDALSELGHEQASRVGEALRERGLTPGLVLAGGLRRHHETATRCLEAMDLPPTWEVDPSWDEYDHNEVLAGLDPRFRSQAEIAKELSRHEQPSRVFQGMFERAMARWVDQAYHAEYRESWPVFCARVEAGLEQLAARLERSSAAVVFTSGGVISVVCRKLLGLSDTRALLLSASIANASITKLISGSRGLTLSTLNEHGHFEGADKRLITYR